MTDTALDESGATANVAEVVDDKSVATAEASTPESTEPKSISLDDAVKTALKKTRAAHKVDDEPKDEPTVAKTEEVKTEAVEKPVKEVDPISGRELEPIKPPASAPLGIKEKWGTLDRKVQQYMIDRDRDIANRLNETIEERKTAKQFQELIAPYEAIFRQTGQNGPDHVKELLTFSHIMATGTPQDRARQVAYLMQRFQPDPAALTHFLGQNLMGAQQPQQQARQLPVEEQVNKAIEARENAAREAEVKTFHERFVSDPANEFAADPSFQMLMGRAITSELVTGNTTAEIYKNAYDFACQQHPEVRDILASRAKPAVAAAPVAPAPKPTPSVKPSLSGGRTATAPAKRMSIDEAIKSAMEKHGIN